MFSLQFVPGPGFERVVAGLAVAAAGSSARLATLGAAVGDAATAALVVAAPYDPDGADPHLRDSFVTETAGGNPTVVTVSNTAPQHQYVIGGHGDIYPVNAKALHFFTHGAEVFTTHVGPVAPNDYPSRALDALVPQLVAIATQDAALIVAELLGG